MRTQFVQMTQAGVKAYYSALKQQRKEAAEFYRDHPECTLGQVQLKFKLSAPTMRKALKENEIEVDRERNYGRKQQRWTCPCCRKQVVHFCSSPEQVEEQVRSAKREERIDPRWIHPITGKRIPWSAEAAAYLEGGGGGGRGYEPDPIDSVTGREREWTDADRYLPGDTPEMKAVALSLHELMERGRKELGLK